jgi:tetratricopeptide (TPR) repeat protein
MGSMGGRGRSPLAVLLLVLGLLWTSLAQAQTSAADKAAAEALFDEGVKLLQKGKYEEACKKLEASERVDSGIGTLLYLADCYEKLGKTASAWATFRAAASKAQNAGQADRARAGMDRANRLESKLVRLSIDAAPETKELEGLSIRRGSEEVPSTLLGTAVPVDPGEYEVVASAPGYLSFTATVTVDPAHPNEAVSVPALEVDPNAPAPSPEPTPAPAAATAEAPSEPASPPGRTQRTVGLVVGGVGVVGLGLGSVLGLMAIDKNNQALNLGCEGDVCPPGQGASLSDAAMTDATLSTVFFIAGGALLATGAVVYFTAPRSNKEKASIDRLRVSGMPGGLAVSLGGSF